MLTLSNSIVITQQGTIAKDGTIVWSRFTGIPRELEVYISMVHINYRYVDPAILLSTLQATKNIEHINMTRIVLDKPIQETVRLSYLKSFILHFLDESIKYENDEVPFRVNESYFKSLLFFDKGYDEQASDTWDIGHITKLNVDIELTISTSKLVSIKHQTGKIMLSNIPFANEIIGSISKNFLLLEI